MPEPVTGDLDWGEALAILRIVRGWRQGQAADAVGIGHSTVSNYEAGRAAPLALLRQMVAAMGFPAHLLDRARAHVRWARAARQLYLQPETDAGAACVEALAGAAGVAREDLARAALAGVLALPAADLAGGWAAPGRPLGAALPEAPAWPAIADRKRARRSGRQGRRGSLLPQTLTVLRRVSGLERPDLGAAIGVSPKVIQSYERGTAAPAAATLERLLAAMGLAPEVFDRTLAFLVAARAAWQSRLREGGAASPRAQIEDFAALEAGRAEDEARAWLGRLQAAVRLIDGRRRAPELWARLAACAEEGQEALVREVAEFQDAGLCELVCEESRNAASDSAQRALSLAALALLVAERVPGEESGRQRLEGYARAHLANALRVGGNLPAAAKAFARAAKLWRAGAAGAPGLLNEARVLHLEASLWRDRREPARALALLDRALAIDRWGETPSLLIGKSKALEELGDVAASIALLRQAAAQLDGQRDRLNLFAVHLNLATNLCHLGRFGQAALGLPEVRALALELGNELDGLRVGWLEAKVAAGLGRTVAAVAGFERVRAGFAARRIAYDAALVTLELAELYAAVGRTAAVKALVRTSVAIFEEQGVHREARRALELFRRAAEEERVSVELIRGVLAYLHRARHDPQLRFQQAG